MKTENEEKLYVPVNVRKRKELVDGFGRKEIIQTSINTSIGLFIGIMTFFLFDYQWLLIVAVPLLFLVGSIIFLIRDKNTNTNAIDNIKETIEFMKSQKKYEYIYHNIYEKEVGKKKNGKERHRS